MPAHVHPHLARKYIDRYLPALRNHGHLRPLASRHVDRLPQAYPIATTFWISQIPQDPHPPTAQTQSAHKSIRRPSNAPYAQSVSRAHTTFAPISAHTPTSVHSSAAYAAKPSRANTTASVTKASTQARRNSSAAATSKTAITGVAAAASPAPML